MTEKMPVFSAVDGSYSKFTEKLTFTPKFCIILNMVLSFISAAFHLKLEIRRRYLPPTVRHPLAAATQDDIPVSHDAA